MRILRDAAAIAAEIKSNPDPNVTELLIRHLEFLNEYSNDVTPREWLTVILVEPGDPIDDIDAAMKGHFLANHYSGKRHGDADFRPAFETLEEYPTFYEMLFIEGDEGFVTIVLVQKSLGIDRELLAVCGAHAQPARTSIHEPSADGHLRVAFSILENAYAHPQG